MINVSFASATELTKKTSLRFTAENPEKRAREDAQRQQYQSQQASKGFMSLTISGCYPDSRRRVMIIKGWQASWLCTPSLLE